MKKEMDPAFGARIKELREAAGFTQASLAKSSGVPLGTIREIEQGKREPLFGTMKRLAKYLNVSLDDLPSPTKVLGS